MKEKMGILITIDYATVEKQYACIVSFANSNTFSLVHILIMGSSFLALNLQFGGFFQNFWKIFQDKVKDHQI